MTVQGPLSKAQLSPNQLAKQRQIVQAAQVVLARDGVAGCTARAVAEASPLTKSAIHYYFADMDDLVDQAMASHLKSFMDRIHASASPWLPPVARFWAAVEEYLGVFQEIPSAALLWFDYWIDATRKGHVEPVDRLNRDVIEIFAGLLAAVPVDQPQKRAEALFSSLLGLIVQQTVRPRPFAAIKEQLWLVCPVEEPAADEAI